MNNEEKNFLQAIQSNVEYWATLDKKAFESAMHYEGLTEAQYRLDGLAFSILCIIDGVSGSNDCHSYELSYGGKVFNDGYLHELFGKFRQSPLTDKRGEL